MAVDCRDLEVRDAREKMLEVIFFVSQVVKFAVAFCVRITVTKLGPCKLFCSCGATEKRSQNRDRVLAQNQKNIMQSDSRVGGT